VPKFSDIQTIKNAYRAKLREQHPDSGRGDISRLQEVLWAYKLLADEAQKRQYDELLSSYANVEAYRQQAYLSVQWALWLHDFLTKEAKKRAGESSLRKPLKVRLLKALKGAMRTELARGP